MTKDEIIRIGKNVVKIEAESVQNLLNSIDDSFFQAVDKIFKSRGRVVLTGMGKSGLIARKIVATMNSTGTAAIFLHPTDALHGDLGMVRKDDVVILLSKSGATEELVNLLPMLKRLEVILIGMVGNLNSKIALDVDIILNVCVKEEACPFDLAPTASTTTMLAMGDALSVCLLERKGFTEQDFALLHPGGSLGKRLSLKISEIMIKGENVPIISKDASIKDTILEITSKRLGTTSVVDDKGKLVGVITDGDLRRLLEKTLDIKDLKAVDIMSKNPKIISKDVLASFALQTMETYKITSLIVADEFEKPIGIVHLHDLLNLGLQVR
ncbi:MAG: KpsF/GutQ family sugar-phosphate isomerase [Ignavibacteria bacterium]|nr:KpsF/GutQ family sugar-phosphate isomerase [Ignavibacteria bacterium]